MDFAFAGGFNSIYDLKDYLFDCPIGLKSLRIDGDEGRYEDEEDNFDDDRAGPLSDNPQPIPSLKELSICNYTPQHTYYDSRTSRTSS